MSSTSFLGSNNKNIMYMQYDTGYIGIGAYDPVAKLDIAGDTKMRSNVQIMGVLTNSNNVVMANNGGSVVINTSSNNLGISTATPVEKVDVTGKVQASSQFLASTSTTVPGYSFTANSNTGMFRPATNTLGFMTAGAQQLTIDGTGNIGMGVNNPSYPLEVAGDTFLRNRLTVANSAMFQSNVTIMGQLNVSNVTYITSNVFIYSTETVQNTLSVKSDFNAAGIASFSNLVRLGSNNGYVEMSQSNNLLGINLTGVAPRADLDISNGNILSKNIQRLSKSADNSNPLALTINWDNAYSSANTYHIVADVYQSIANGDYAGFRNQRIGVGVSNALISWVKNIEVFGSSNAYTTLDLAVSANTNKSVTLQSSTNWGAPGAYTHGLNVDIVHFPYSSNIGNLYLT